MTVTPGTFATDDGGVTWRRLDRTVVSLSLAGSVLFGLERREDGSATLVRSADDGETWTEVGRWPGP